MPHFAQAFCSRVNEVLHDLVPTRSYKEEFYEVPGVPSALLVTYDNVRDDSFDAHEVTLEQFLGRMTKVRGEWRETGRSRLDFLASNPAKGIGGAEGKTYYVIRAGQDPQHWTAKEGQEFIIGLLMRTAAAQPEMIRWRVEHLREDVPVGREHFADFEDAVRIIFNFLFSRHLKEGRAQERTEPENEGIEIRDLIFANSASSGFWKDLKDKYAVSEVVVDAKNTDLLTRDDLRQLYCYLKPALGHWGFLVCRKPQPAHIHAFNRSLFKNFAQQRGLLILADDDLKRMVAMALRGHDPSEYLAEKMSEFVRSV